MSDDVALAISVIGAVSALLGAIVGGLVAFLTEFCLRRGERKHLARQLARGLAGEIAALVDIVERRQYSAGLRAAAAAGTMLSVTVTRNYFKVFDVNANQMGLLRDELPELVTGFYVRATALTEDFDTISKPQFALQSVADRGAYYRAMADLLDDTSALGKKAAEGLKKT